MRKVLAYLLAVPVCIAGISVIVLAGMFVGAAVLVTCYVHVAELLEKEMGCLTSRNTSETKPKRRGPAPPAS